DIGAISIVAVVGAVGSAVSAKSIRPAVKAAVARTVAHAKANIRTRVRGSRHADRACKSCRRHQCQENAFHVFPFSLVSCIARWSRTLRQFLARAASATSNAEAPNTFVIAPGSFRERLFACCLHPVQSVKSVVHLSHE